MGSLVVELLVVVPLFVLLAAIGVWFYRLHVAQTTVFQRAREDVWPKAIKSCGGAAAGQGPLAIDGARPDVVLRPVPGGPHGDLPVRGFGGARGQADGTLEGFAMAGTREVQMAAASRVLCNEPVRDGELDAMKRIAAGAFRK